MNPVYLGRIVAFAVSPLGRAAALYRVSSRSFPNRMAEAAEDGKRVAIVPKPGHEADMTKNPYIAYNAVRLVGRAAIAANGSQTDPVAEKIAMGMPIRDAVALSLLALDYEKDDYSTPRVVAVASIGERIGWLGSIRKDGLDVRSFALEPGTVVHVSTYEHDIPTEIRVSPFTAESAEEACQFLFNGGEFNSFTNPVTAVAAMERGNAFELAAKDM